MHSRFWRKLLLVALCTSTGAAAPASARIFVGEPTNGCGSGGFCRGPSDLKYKPRSLRLVAPGDGYSIIDAKKLRWTDWGNPRAVGRGRARVGDPDNGYTTARVRIVLSKIVAAGCSDEAGRYRAYSRARLTSNNPVFGRGTSFDTLGC